MPKLKVVYTAQFMVELDLTAGQMDMCSIGEAVADIEPGEGEYIVGSFETDTWEATITDEAGNTKPWHKHDIPGTDEYKTKKLDEGAGNSAVENEDD
jgi:hypothetical protein